MMMYPLVYCRQMQVQLPRFRCFPFGFPFSVLEEFLDLTSELTLVDP